MFVAVILFCFAGFKVIDIVCVLSPNKEGEISQTFVKCFCILFSYQSRAFLYPARSHDLAMGLTEYRAMTTESGME